MPRIDNQTYATGSVGFLVGCELAEIKPTARQAGKFRRRQGAARAEWDGIVRDKSRKADLNERMQRIKAAI